MKRIVIRLKQRTKWHFWDINLYKMLNYL